MKKRGEDKPIALVAFGGNALTQKGERGTAEEYWKNAELTARQVMCIVRKGFEMLLTHGNGPQVGNMLLRSELARNIVPPLPLDICGAATEGEIGYVLQQALLNELRRCKIRKYVVTMITQVLVDPRDPAFKRPSKPIGPFYTAKEAADFKKKLGWTMIEDSGRGWRRVVPSPVPLKIIQRISIADLVSQGDIVIAGGGGGIPIIKDENGNYKGVEAVIDKDLVSAMLASLVGAELLVILTQVPHVYIDFGKPSQRELKELDVKELVHHHRNRQFPAGSMGPKVDAAIQFLTHGGKKVIITDPASLEAALENKAGTRIYALE